MPRFLPFPRHAQSFLSLRYVAACHHSIASSVGDLDGDDLNDIILRSPDAYAAVSIIVSP
ncbi:MAG: hypothetical protein COA70_06265 [Planctomycetota bacterium]|nr:MAG: hypothetical protein COA70_06265 [Planctomycetota bacterium]